VIGEKEEARDTKGMCHYKRKGSRRGEQSVSGPPLNNASSTPGKGDSKLSEEKEKAVRTWMDEEIAIPRAGKTVLTTPKKELNIHIEKGSGLTATRPWGEGRVLSHLISLHNGRLDKRAKKQGVQPLGRGCEK